MRSVSQHVTVVHKARRTLQPGGPFCHSDRTISPQQDVRLKTPKILSQFHHTQVPFIHPTTTIVSLVFVFSFAQYGISSSTNREAKMYGAGSELSIVSRSTMSTWISDRHFVDEIHKKRRRVCKRWRKTCTRDLLYRRLPFLSWITKYDFSKLLSDANAGMAVSLTAIPQTIGYAAVAGLPAQVSVPPHVISTLLFLPGLFFLFRVICCVCSEQFFYINNIWMCIDTNIRSASIRLLWARWCTFSLEPSEKYLSVQTVFSPWWSILTSARAESPTPSS